MNSFCDDSGNIFQPSTIFFIADCLSISCRKKKKNKHKTDHVHFSFSDDTENTRDCFKIIYYVIWRET